MFKKIKSHWIVLVILLQKLFDNLHRMVIGISSYRRSQISVNLYLGGQYNLNGLKRLKKMGITAIVSMRVKSIFNEEHYDGINFLHLPTIDNTAPTLQDLIRGTEFVDAEIKKKGKVYIHCRQGLGRGPSLAIAYLINLGITYDDAYTLVKFVRPFINPNPMQIERLKEFENYLKEHKMTKNLKITPN